MCFISYYSLTHSPHMEQEHEKKRKMDQQFKLTVKLKSVDVDVNFVLNEIVKNYVCQELLDQKITNKTWLSVPCADGGSAYLRMKNIVMWYIEYIK